MEITPGISLGRYELLLPIASGGMAEVWVGRMKGTRGFSKVVALKLLLGELVDDEQYEKMFLDEAELASRIRHANVAEILDLGEHDEVLYLVMEWVDGQPLQVVMREYRESIGIPYYLAAKIGAQACAGLHCAHELKDDEGKPLGIVHRDVTPQNLLITYDGVVKVVDFGVAKAASNLQKTTVGQTKGKAPYMSPEQARSEVVDRRTDVFALGIVLYQLTTAKHPFRGENDLITLRNILVPDPAKPPVDEVPGYPRALSDVIVKALQKNRDLRYPDMMEMMEALDQASLELDQGEEELGEFMTRLLGPRGEKRRIEINAAVAKSVRGSDPELPNVKDLEKAGAVPGVVGAVPAAAPGTPPPAAPGTPPPASTGTPVPPRPASSPQLAGPPPPPRGRLPSSPRLGEPQQFGPIPVPPSDLAVASAPPAQPPQPQPPVAPPAAPALTPEQQANLARQEQQVAAQQQFAPAAPPSSNPVATPLPAPHGPFPSSDDLAPPMQQIGWVGPVIIGLVAMLLVLATWALIKFVL